MDKSFSISVILLLPIMLLDFSNTNNVLHSSLKIFFVHSVGSCNNIINSCAQVSRLCFFLCLWFKKSHNIGNFKEHHHNELLISQLPTSPNGMTQKAHANTKKIAVKKEKCQDFYDNSDTFLVCFMIKKTVSLIIVERRIIYGKLF